VQPLPASGQTSLEPFAIPTSAVEPHADGIVFATFQNDPLCFSVYTIEGTSQGPTILPIWPKGFTATIGPRGSRQLYSGPGQEKNAFAVESERLELHGDYVDTAPADAVVAPECAKYPLFLVGRAFNRT
jgi:hypothetical protein